MLAFEWCNMLSTKEIFDEFVLSGMKMRRMKFKSLTVIKGGFTS